MKKFILFLLLITFYQFSYAAFSVATKTDTSASLLVLPGNQNVQPSESLLARKLTFKERISSILFKKYLGQQDPEVDAKKANSNAVLGLVFGVLGIIVFPLFAIPGLILSNKAIQDDKVSPGILGRNYGLAKAGQILSWIGLVLLVITVTLLSIFLVAGGFH